MRLWFTLPVGVDEQQFDVSVGGKTVVRKIARGRLGVGAVAVSQDHVTASKGTIDLKFLSKQDKAMVSLIEISKVR